MAITLQQSQSILRVQHNQRKAYLNKWAVNWNNYYLAQMKIYFEEGNTNRMFLEPVTQEVLTATYVDVGTQFAKFGFASVKSNAFNFEYKAAADEMVGWTEAMIRYSRTYGAKSVVSINATGQAEAEKIIQQIIADSIEQGLGADATAQYIEDQIWLEWRHASKFNALRIARTEIIAASNRGAFEGAKSTGLEQVKIWLTVMDGRERDSHAAANRQTVKMDERFAVGGELLNTPVSGSIPENNIQCRCGVHYQAIEMRPNRVTFN